MPSPPPKTGLGGNIDFPRYQNVLDEVWLIRALGSLFTIDPMCIYIKVSLRLLSTSWTNKIKPGVCTQSR